MQKFTHFSFDDFHLGLSLVTGQMVFDFLQHSQTESLGKYSQPKHRYHMFLSKHRHVFFSLAAMASYIRLTLMTVRVSLMNCLRDSSSP